MTVTILILVFNIVSLSVIATLSEINRRKMDKVHSELRKFTRVADEITTNPAKVRYDLRHAMQVMDHNLSKRISRPFPGAFDLDPEQPFPGRLFADSPDLLGDHPQCGEDFNLGDLNSPNGEEE